MTQQQVLEEAIEKLINRYRSKIEGYDIDEFLKTGIDPFRFTVNISLWGLEQAIRKEIEHKAEMALENLIGDFHEDYLGNAIHVPSNTKWRRIKQGEIPGIDIANKELRFYLQIKSKHNSMNSSSAKRLANELSRIAEQDVNAIVGCAWIVATQGKSANGEKYISQVAKCYKGSKAYEVVTGNENELIEVLVHLVHAVETRVGRTNFNDLLDSATKRVVSKLVARADRFGKTVIQIIADESID